MAGEFLTWVLACVGENNFVAIPPQSEAVQLPMNELIEPCLPPDIDVCPIDPATMDYAEDCVDFVESAQSKFVTAVEDHMRMSYQELISGGEPVTVLAVHEDDQGNYKSRTKQVLAFTSGDYFFQETEFPLRYLSTGLGFSPQVPPGDWLICRAGYAWSACPEADWGEFAQKSLDYFAGEQAGSRSADNIIGHNDYSGEFFGLTDGNSEFCPEASGNDWTVFEEVYDEGGEGFDFLNYSRDDFDLTQAKSSFQDHFEAVTERVESLASVVLSDAGGTVIDDKTFGAYYCKNNLCYDVEFE